MKTARRKFMVPIPKLHDLDTLNERLMARCLERLDALEEGEQAVALLADLEALRTLPASPFEACEHMPGQVSSTALVRYRLVDYSAPTIHAHKKVMVKGYVDRVEIALGAEIVARHRRSYVRGAFLGGIPRSILYDNTTLAVARILGDGTRRRPQAFSHLQSHYLFRDRFGRPGKGNDKGKVEALVKTARRKFMVPIPKLHDLDTLNERLMARCLERLDALEEGEQAVALLADLEALRTLPASPFEACEHMPGQVSSTALVRYRLVDYSAPTMHAHKKVMVKGYVDRVEIALGAEIVARHRRSYVRGAFLGGIPRSILYDNTTLAVARILGDGTRRRTQAFSHLQSHYLFRDRFGRPGKGNDKGKVEALVKTARRKFMVPIPKLHDLDTLNERLMARCLERLDALEEGEQAVALLADLEALRTLPASPFEACEHMPGQVSSTALVRYRLVDYSAPTIHAHKKVMVKGYVDRVEIALGAEIVARHRRSC